VPPSEWATWDICCEASEEGFAAESRAEVVRVRGDVWEMSRWLDGRARRTRRVNEIVDIFYA